MPCVNENKNSNWSTAKLPALRVEVLAFKPHVKNTMQGGVDLTLPAVGLKFLGSTLREKNGLRWISLPARDYPDKGVRNVGTDCGDRQQRGAGSVPESRPWLLWKGTSSRAGFSQW